MSNDANLSTEADVAFLVATVKAIVDNPDDVIAERIVDDLGVLIKLRVNATDMSKIVGKEGKTAKALRTLLRLVGSKIDQRVNLKILEPDGSERRIEQSENPRPARVATKPVKITEKKNSETTKTETPSQEGADAGAAFENVI
ncbi:KH domain-containing protein [Candidatus Gracilibacteria bacterium]|nr:KH domain-containing protein [Candidatus Gracilibacteria bacterium]MCF7856310.1 KH domain-containing protein [Candidatus Gracilibacteria bacterium]MCF7896665.1 KH domain-containing protein [Candidatus Gracilibacteria bacterium]